MTRGDTWHEEVGQNHKPEQDIATQHVARPEEGSIPPAPEFPQDPVPPELASSAAASSASISGDFVLADLTPENWCQLLEQLGLRGIVYNIASHCELRSRNDDALHFVLDEGNAGLFNDGHSDKLRMALENYFGRPLSVTVVPETLQRETPAMRTARMASERQQEAVVAIEGDRQLQSLIARFDGQLDRSSIVPTDA